MNFRNFFYVPTNNKLSCLLICYQKLCFFHTDFAQVQHYLCLSDLLKTAIILTHIFLILNLSQIFTHKYLLETNIHILKANFSILGRIYCSQIQQVKYLILGKIWLRLSASTLTKSLLRQINVHNPL